MKIILTTILLALGLSISGLSQNTNEITVNQLPEETRQIPFTVELTIGGGGMVTSDNESTYGMDFSIGTNPFKSIPSIWIGLVQGLYWEPSFSGSTDLYSDYSFLIYKDSLYLNVGWSGGIVYDTETVYWRTGPEVTFQYYVSDDAFIYVGANYDFNFDENVENGIRYGFGIGLSF